MERTTDRPDDGPDPSHAHGILGGPDSLGRALERWAADAAVDEAARARARARWLRIAAEEEASLAGTLVDLAEQGRPVVLDAGGQRVQGVVVGVAEDFVAVRTDQGQQALVRLDAIEVVRSDPGAADVVGDRPATLDVSLAAVLGPVAADRPDVLVRTRQGVAVRGQLRGAADDSLRLRLDGDRGAPAWVSLAAVALLVLDP